jgi:alpha-D-xyloside xylohydrolase
MKARRFLDIESQPFKDEIFPDPKDQYKGYQTIAVGKIPAIILVRDGSLIPHAPLAQRTDEIDWRKVELKPYKAAATTCTGLLFKPGDTEIQMITQ